MGVSEGGSWGWTSTRVLGLFAVAAVLFVVWVYVEMRMDMPLVDMTMMRRRGVWTTNLAAFVFGFGMFSSFVLVPEFVETSTSSGFGFGASITQAGLYLLPATGAMLLAGPVSGRLSATVGSRVPLILGSIVSTVAFALLALAHDHGWQIYLAMAILGVGIGLAFASMANLIVEAVPATQTGVATGMNTIVRTVGGAIGSQVAAGIVTATATGDRRGDGTRVHACLRGVGDRARRGRGRGVHGAAAARRSPRAGFGTGLDVRAQSFYAQRPMARRVRRGFIVAKIKPGSEDKVAELFAESDREGELPGIMGVTHRSLAVLGDVYIHYVEMDEDLATKVDEHGGHDLFREISRKLDEYITPYDPETWRSPNDARARVFYTWDAEAE